MFCPSCGDIAVDDEQGGFGERGLCRRCFLEGHELIRLPETITIDRCGGCGSLNQDGTWVDSTEDLIEVAVDTVTDTIQVHQLIDDLHWDVRPEMIDEETVRIGCTFHLEFAGTWEQRERTVTVSFESTTCPRCGRIAGKDFGAIVQLRGQDRTPVPEEATTAREITASVLDERVEVGDREAFLTDVVERDEGLDLRVSTPRLGQQIASAINAEMGGTLETSSTLVTTDGDGREVHRVTYTLRLPPYRAGDIITTDDGPALVESGGSRVRVLDLRSGTSRNIDAADHDGTRVARTDDATPVTIVAFPDEHAVQVLHPTTHETVTVARVPWVDRTDETVPAIEIDGEVYLLPVDDV